MARPRTISDETLLAAAATAIGRRGPAFTIADVASEAGVAAGTLIGRFGSKRGLLLAVAAAGRARTVARMRAAGSGARAVRAALVAGTEGLEDPVRAANHLAQLGADLADPELRAALVADRRARRAELRRLVAGATDLPGAPPPARAADVLLSLLDGTLLAWSLDPRGALAKRVRRDVDVVLRGWRAA